MLDFAALYEAYAPEFRAHTLRHLPPDDVDDVVAQTFEAALRNAAGYDERGQVKSWLYRILHSRIIDRYRQRGRDQTTPLVDDDAIDPMDDRIIACHVVRQLLPLADLTAMQRRVLYLRFAERLDPADVARQLGITYGAAKAHQHRGLEKLRRVYVD